MTITMDRRSGIRRLKVSTNNSEAISSERCTFWDTRLSIAKFNAICLAFINADRAGAAVRQCSSSCRLRRQLTGRMFPSTERLG